MGEETGIYFADSRTLKVCHNKRIHNHKVFKDLAQTGKSTMGWFFGLKLHLIINHKREAMTVKITPENIDDRKALEEIVHDLQGKCSADKGFIGKDISKSSGKKDYISLITSHYWNSQKYETIPHALYR